MDELPVVVCLSFGRWNIAERLQSVVVEQIHPFRCGKLWQDFSVACVPSICDVSKASLRMGLYNSQSTD